MEDRIRHSRGQAAEGSSVCLALTYQFREALTLTAHRCGKTFPQALSLSGTVPRTRPHHCPHFVYLPPASFSPVLGKLERVLCWHGDTFQG